MISLDCARSRSLLTAAAGGHATDAERLELEDHLERCERCRADRGALEILRRLSGWEPPQLSDSARERVRRAALSVAQQQRAAPATARRWAPLLLASLFAAVGALALWQLRPAPESRILDGDLVVEPLSGRAIGDGARLSSGSGGRAVLGGPVVALAASSALVWHAATRTVSLEDGEVRVEVDPAQGKSFRVDTPRFRVEVVGTRFSVDMQGVRTERGKVRVLGLDGSQLALVGAGEAWALTEVPAPAAPESTAEPAAAPAAQTRSATSSPARLVDRDERLARARAALAIGDGAAARTLLQPLLRGPRADAAEAHILLAESFLVERRYADALQAYQAVVRSFEGSVQAESALYAISLLALEHGGGDDAVRALTRYLEAYPHGRFAREARDRLDGLTSSSP